MRRVLLIKWIHLITVTTGIATDSETRSGKQDEDKCLFPNGSVGVCVSLKNCPPVIALLNISKENKTFITYLRKLGCGYENEYPKVCCPQSSSSQVRSDMLSKLPSPPACGVPPVVVFPRIVGGRPAKLGQWPWMAALGYTKNNSAKVQWNCGGALITGQHVLTAAHCVLPENPAVKLVKVRLGDLDLNDTVGDDAKPDDLKVVKAVIHANYQVDKQIDDIAILKLEKPVQFTSQIQPICLPKTDQLRSMKFTEMLPHVAGWGSLAFKGAATTRLHEVQVPILRNDDCGIKYDTYIPDKLLCAGYTEGGKDSCQGDSGGPLMLPIENVYYTVGIVQGGYKCAVADSPGLYIRVTEYINWIAQNVQV